MINKIIRYYFTGFIYCVILLICEIGSAQKITSLFETSEGKETPDYFEIIKWWQKLDIASDKVTMKRMGNTDAGYPLHLITVSNQPVQSFIAAHQQHKTIILINNGIHPGEPDGIDASMLLVRDIAEKKILLPDNIVLAIIPVYNIGGCLNRSKYYRVDQNGPEAFGSRGNPQNLDLNRDFIKCDTKEAIAFTEIFHMTDPDIFVDNHVSNGADYQHVMTLLITQYNKMGGAMGKYLHEKFEPGLYALMKKEGFDLIPYVNDFSKNIIDGWDAFWDSPRYSSGYATLFNTFSFVPETHMLKPYSQRVKATYILMKCFISFAHANGPTIQQLRAEAKKEVVTATKFAWAFTLDSSKASTITFKGFESIYKPSAISGQPRLFYDRKKPYTRLIPFYNFYIAKKFITKPKAYIIPQGWWKVIERLKVNQIQMQQLLKDSNITVETYYITNYKPSSIPYQSHHANTDVTVEKKILDIFFRKGDWIIPMNQAGNRFLIETLEPYCEDSYFTWNFFDGILNLKEWYSDYHYEDVAAVYLKENPELQAALEKKREADTSFAKDGMAQLTYIFNASPYKDADYRRYPVYRIMN